MATFIGFRSFANHIADLDENQRLRFVGARRKSPFVWALGASLSLLGIALALPAGAQSSGTDASVAAASTSVLNLVRWAGTAPEAAGKTVEMSFALYQDPAGGLAIWNETQAVKVASDGRYTVLLGATSAEGLPQALFQAGDARWIEARPIGAQLIAANGGEAEVEAANAKPVARSLLAAVPYALKSMDAETLGGRAAADFVTREDLKSSVDQAVETLKQPNPLPIHGRLPMTPVTLTTGPGAPGYLPLWTGTTSLGNSLIAQSGQNVGIGTSAPASILDVNGASTFRGALGLLATAANLAAGINSPALQLGASTYSSTNNAAVPQNFVWQAQSAGNNTPKPAANLALLFGAGTTPPTPTGLSIAPNGQITFAPGQTFPGTGGGSGPTSTLTGVTAGPGLTGGGSTGNVTLALSMPISAANGGTGASTPTRALANLGIPMESVLNYGARGDGVTDDGAAINAALAANSRFTSPCVFFPAATFYTTQTIVTGGASICGQTGKGSIIKYHGTGAGLQIGSSSTFTGGRIENLTVFSDGGNGAVGIQVTQGTELVMRNIEVGGSPALKFTIGWNFIQTSGAICDVCTSSWNPIGIRFGWGSFANSAIEIKGGNFWEASKAAFQIDDAAELDVHNNWIEHTPTAFLFTNSESAIVATSITISHNWGVTLSTTFSDPKFIRVIGANSATSLNAWSIQVSANTYGAGGMNSFCNQIDWANTYPGSIGRFYFDHNHFSGCTVAGVNSTTNAFNVQTDVSDRVEGTYPSSPSLPMLAGKYTLIQAAETSSGSKLLPFPSVFIGKSAAISAQIISGALTAPRTMTLPDADSNTVQPLAGAPSGGCVGYIDAKGVQHGASCALLSGSITLTSAPSDNATIPGLTKSSHCVLSATNSIAAAPMTLPYISAVTTNTLTISHAAAGEGGTFNILCALN